MKKIIFAALLLGACQSAPQAIETLPAPAPQPEQQAPQQIERIVEVPIRDEAPRVNVPGLPEALREEAPKLAPMVDGTIKGVMRDGAKTDSLYNDLRTRYNALVRFYDCVRDAVNESSSAAVEQCKK